MQKGPKRQKKLDETFESLCQLNCCLSISTFLERVKKIKKAKKAKKATKGHQRTEKAIEVVKYWPT